MKRDLPDQWFRVVHGQVPKRTEIEDVIEVVMGNNDRIQRPEVDMFAELEQRARPQVDYDRGIALGNKESSAAGTGVRPGRAAAEDGELHRTGSALTRSRCAQSLNRWKIDRSAEISRCVTLQF